MGWEENVRKVVPYVPGEQPTDKDIIKLNTNECPYPPSPEVERVLRSYDAGSLRLYPDTRATILTEQLAAYYHLKKEQLFVGVGSDDVLAMCFLTFFHSGRPVFFPDITYSFYDVWAELFRIPYEQKKLDASFHLVPEDYKKPNGGILFPNPNAPTGLTERLETVEEIVRSNPDVVVIIDEAYVDFGGESALGLIGKYENLLVVQTFSKSRALAGMRIGFAAGSEKLISCLNDVKFSFNSYTINSLTAAAGAASVKDEAYFKETVEKVIATRERTKERLRKLGFSFPDSRGNFLFAAHRSVPAAELFEMLKREHIYVRYFDRPRIDNYLRISIGTDAQMDELIRVLEQDLAGR